MRLVEIVEFPDHEKNGYPNPSEPGWCLFRVWRLTGEKPYYQALDWDDIEIVAGDGGGFYSVSEGIGVDYYLSGIGFRGHGWYIIEGLTEHFSKDFWGEVDAETNYTDIRRARLPEVLCETAGARWVDVRLCYVWSFLREFVK